MYNYIFLNKKIIIIVTLIIIGVILLIPILCILTCLHIPQLTWEMYCEGKAKGLKCFSSILSLELDLSCTTDCIFHPLRGIRSWISQFK